MIALGAEYVREQREAGESWESIARELGIVTPTAQRWAKLPSSSTATFHAVAIVEPSARAGFAAVLPGGLRIEGLGLGDVIALAKALS